MPRFPDEILLLDSEWFHSHFGTDIDDLLCRPSADHASILERLGVRRLTEVARIELDFSEGQESHEELFAMRLRDRTDCVLRLLHDKGSATRASIEEKLRTITARSFDQLKVIASIELDAPFVSEARPVQAFYEGDENRLTLARPVSNKSWPQAFNALFHHFLVSESGADISKLSAVCWNLVREDTIEDAHQFLNDIGMPPLVGTPEIAPPESQPLDDLGASQEPTVVPAANSRTEPTGPVAQGATKGPASVDLTPARESGPGPKGSEPGRPAGPEQAGRSDEPPGGWTPLKPKKRPGFKRQWDQALRTYARPKTGEPTESDPEKHRRRLAVEASSRKIVCDWELKHGRQPAELEQGHPGYDIVSTNPRTGEQRLIEVKGIDGEWNRTGVGVTRTEFGNAQHFGEKYWLYVVEWALDENAAHIRPIRNPATQVEEFMFDSGWRDLAEGDPGDPSDAFVPGARGLFDTWGKGTIITVERKTGGSVVLFVDIDGVGPRTMTLNLQTMRIVDSEEGDGDDDS